MIASMTGFGAARARVGDEEISVEIRSVNHKYCEVKPRLPMELAMLETELVRSVKDALKRGAVEVFVKRGRAQGPALAPRVDAELARQYVAALEPLADALKLQRNLGLAEVIQLDGVLVLEERGVHIEQAKAALQQALTDAVGGLVQMRRREGVALADDLRARLALLKHDSDKVKQLSPATVDTYRARLEERIAELSRGVDVDPQRLAAEVAIFADRTDVTEEMTRFASHLEQFHALIASDEPAGRKMDFLVQEMNREVNTTGSKSQSAELAQLIVAMKAEIERIREQVQNVE